MNGPAFGCCLAVSGDGSRLIVTGSIGDAYGTFQSYTTVAYVPATGSQLWTTTFAGSGAYSIPSAVAVTKNGQVAIVTGTIIGPDSNYDWATVAFRT